eukprot:5647562-Pleurochrysis_carterae.AAC.1
MSNDSLAQTTTSDGFCCWPSFVTASTSAIAKSITSKSLSSDSTSTRIAVMTRLNASNQSAWPVASAASGGDAVVGENSYSAS